MTDGDQMVTVGAEAVKSAGDRAAFLVDPLTGAHRRDAGVLVSLELEHAAEKAERTDQSLVLAFIRLDGLKATIASLGHATGDRLLCRMANTIRATFATEPNSSASVGLAKLVAGERVEDLIGRADAAMYRARQHKRRSIRAIGSIAANPAARRPGLQFRVSRLPRN